MDMLEYSGKDDAYACLLHYNAIFRKHRKSMQEIVDHVQAGLYDAAQESWEELPQDDQIVLNRAWTKGGFLTPQERDIAVKGVDKATGWSSWNEGVSRAAGDGP